MESRENLLGVRCHKCRQDLNVPDTTLTGSHGGDETLQCCETSEDGALIFISEDRLPNWIRGKVEEEGWMKGKLHCPSCGGKVGSFDFVSGRKCGCGQYVLPPVHLIRSLVDTTVNVTRDLFTNISEIVPQVS